MAEMTDAPRFPMTHPDTGGVYVAVSEDQADELAKDGWQRGAKSVATGRNKRELLDLAADLGVDVEPTASKQAIADALSSADPKDA